jgi:hypothetical protein
MGMAEMPNGASLEYPLTLKQDTKAQTLQEHVTA